MDVSYLISELWWKGGQKITKNKLHPTLLCILNHSMSTLRKAEGCMCCQWMESVLRPRPQCVAFISVPACEGIKVNERGDSLTGKQWAKLLFWMLLRLSIFSFQVQLHVLARKLEEKIGPASKSHTLMDSLFSKTMSDGSWLLSLLDGPSFQTEGWFLSLWFDY